MDKIKLVFCFIIFSAGSLSAVPPLRFHSAENLKASITSVGFNDSEQKADKAPVADVFEVMKTVHELGSPALWPGFDITGIPALIYDGLNTYQFHSASPYDGFSPVADKPDVFIYTGQHPSVRGNSVVRMGDVWTATSVLSNMSRRTRETYTIRDMAGIIIHEEFHIFQRIHHPDWRQNDGLLLIYPPETVESLFLRRIEKEAFKRGAVAREIAETAAWAREGLRYREKRLGLVDSPFALYEKELQRTEGISDYIEKIARGSAPLASSSISKGIAPAGVRDLGYIEGRWIAMMLDKVKPDWKPSFDERGDEYLEDVLKTAVSGFDSTSGFTDTEMSGIMREAEADFKQWEADKKQRFEDFYNRPGITLEIDSTGNPLGIRIFEPLEIEIMSNKRVFHKVIFMAGNENGHLRIRNHACVTGFDDSYRIVKTTLTGLKNAPQVDEKEKVLRLDSDGVSIEFKYAAVSIQGDTLTVVL